MLLKFGSPELDPRWNHSILWADVAKRIDALARDALDGIVTHGDCRPQA